VEQTWSGTVSLPVALGVELTDVRVFGVAATLSNASDDGTTRTADYSATATCDGVCTWVEVTVVSGTDELLLQAPTPEDVSLETTALMALDISRAEAAARIGASGLVPGMRPDLDALVPTVVSALVDAWTADADLHVLPGGAPEPGTDVFAAVDAALAGPLPAPDVPTDAPTWKLHAVTPPAGARLVAWDGNKVSLPLQADAGGSITFVSTRPAEETEHLVLRYVQADGSQSPATVVVRGPQGPVTPSFSVSATDGGAVGITGATTGSWIAQRSNTTGERAACTVDATGAAVLSVERTTGFTVIELDPDLAVLGLVGCTWSGGEPSCSAP
ncbi:MAG: hypothetical protein KC656_35660, partial [Myxococcales bacterium]|nr:hypothetical protein [Myxococcales bacterium]